MTDEGARPACREAYGEVSSVKVLMDRETGRPRGFGFVEMPNQNEAESAVAEVNGIDSLVREAFPEILPMLVLRGLAIMSGRPGSPALRADV